MDKDGMREGHEYTVQVYIDQEMVAAFVMEVLEPTIADTNVYMDRTAPLIAIHEALAASSSAVDFEVQKPRMRELLEARIAELKREREREEGDPPTLSTDEGDFPF